MKKLLSILIVFLCFSCEKSEDSNSNSINTKIQGTWVLDNDYKNVFLVIKSDRIFRLTKSDKPITAGGYSSCHLFKDGILNSNRLPWTGGNDIINCVNNKNIEQIITSNPLYQMKFLEVTETKITFRHTSNFCTDKFRDGEFIGAVIVYKKYELVDDSTLHTNLMPVSSTSISQLYRHGNRDIDDAEESNVGPPEYNKRPEVWKRLDFDFDYNYDCLTQI